MEDPIFLPVNDSIFEDSHCDHLGNETSMSIVPVVQRSTIRAPNHSGNMFKTSIEFSDLERDAIVKECTSQSDRKMALKIAKTHYVRPNLIKKWAKDSDLELPVYQSKIGIVQKCSKGKISPAKLADINKISLETVRS